MVAYQQKSPVLGCFFQTSGMYPHPQNGDRRLGGEDHQNPVIQTALLPGFIHTHDAAGNPQQKEIQNWMP
jgi:hypothetical protein